MSSWPIWVVMGVMVLFSLGGGYYFERITKRRALSLRERRRLMTGIGAIGIYTTFATCILSGMGSLSVDFVLAGLLLSVPTAVLGGIAVSWKVLSHEGQVILLYRAAKSHAGMAERSGRPEEAAAYRKEAERLRSRLHGRILELEQDINLPDSGLF